MRRDGLSQHAGVGVGPCVGIRGNRMRRTDEEEARDREDEAKYWRNYKKKPGFNCLFVLLALASVGLAVPVWALLG